MNIALVDRHFLGHFLDIRFPVKAAVGRMSVGKAANFKYCELRNEHKGVKEPQLFVDVIRSSTVSSRCGKCLLKLAVTTRLVVHKKRVLCEDNENILGFQTSGARTATQTKVHALNVFCTASLPGSITLHSLLRRQHT